MIKISEQMLESNFIIYNTPNYSLISLSNIAYNITAIWLLFEILFLFYIKFLVAPSLSKPTKGLEHWFKHPKEMMLDIYNLLETIENYSFEKFISGFFHMTDFKNIYATNYDSFLAWAIYCSHLKDLNKEQMEIIVKQRDFVSKKFDFVWKEEYNPNIRHAQINLEKIDYIHRPLIFGALLYAIELRAKINIYWPIGFKKILLPGGASYWIYENKTSKETPTVIMHGICSGWSYFSELAKQLSVERTVILFDYDCIKMNSMSFNVPTASEVNYTMIRIIQDHGIEKVNLIGHSWGTFLVGWIIRMNPQIIEHVVFVDPMCLAVIFPEGIYTLMYKKPKQIVDHLLNIFVRKDLTISYSIHRQFSWYNMAISLDEIPKNIKITVGIADKDELIPFPALIEMIETHNQKRTENKDILVKSFIWQGLSHSDAITNNTCIRDIIISLSDHSIYT